MKIDPTVNPIYETERLCRMGLYETAWIIEGVHAHKLPKYSFDTWFDVYSWFSGLR